MNDNTPEDDMDHTDDSQNGMSVDMDDDDNNDETMKEQCFCFDLFHFPFC